MRDTAAALLGASLAAWCMLSAAQALRIAAARQPDPVTALDIELRALGGALPPSGVIGYVDAANAPGSVEALRMRHVAQYALAPRVVAFDTTAEFVVVPSAGVAIVHDPRLKGFYPIASVRGGHHVYRRLLP